MNLLDNIYTGPAGLDPDVKLAIERVDIIRDRLLETSSLMYRDKKSTVVELLCQLHGEIAHLTRYLAIGNGPEALQKVAAARCVLDIIASVIIKEK